MTVLARESETVDMIDLERTESDRQRALKILRESKDEHDLAEAQAALARRSRRCTTWRGLISRFTFGVPTNGLVLGTNLLAVTRRSAHTPMTAHATMAATSNSWSERLALSRRASTAANTPIMLRKVSTRWAWYSRARNCVIWFTPPLATE